ncbi:MAG: glycosyltransferase family 39 protein [Anaerolineae bacterium]|nr:glycosyltransferase family 39 protein [Anaerolineae bacterium]
MSASFPARLAGNQISALALKRVPPPALVSSLVLLILHASGLTLVAQLARVPFWVVVVAILVLVTAQFLPRVRAILSPGLLAPFWFVYLAVGLRFVWLRVLRGEIQGYFEYTLPDPRVLLHFEFLVGAALVYGALILLAQLAPSRGATLALAAVVGVGAIFGWAVIEYFGNRTYGATGSDPFAYVQMGIDLATHGTPGHVFELFPIVSNAALSWFPLVHVGYHLPMTPQGDAVTVWPFGGSLVYASAFLAAGEPALYLVNPLFSSLSILAAGLLAWELTRNDSRTVRIVTACITACLVATSNEIVDWAGVTMVDTQALVFSTLAFYCALRVYRGGNWGWAVGAGVLWGLAYLVRHTQLVIALGFVPLFLFAHSPRRLIIRNSLIALGAAFLIATPDLWYHQLWFGSPFAPESQELALYSFGAIPTALAALGASALTGAEFGWLLLFVVVGMALYTRRERVPGVALWLTLGAVLAVHLPYPALRLRDLIPELPIIAFYASCGIVESIARLWRQKRAWATAAAGLVLFLAFEFMLVRVWNTLPRVVQEPEPRFGAMTQQQRDSFDTLVRLTLPDAIVGTTLNSGAVELYSGRSAVRPGGWSEAELREFLQIAHANGREFYLLQDNAEIARAADDLRRDYNVELVGTLDVPLFGEDIVPNAGTLWRISRD